MPQPSFPLHPTGTSPRLGQAGGRERGWGGPLPRIEGAQPTGHDGCHDSNQLLLRTQPVSPLLRTHAGQTSSQHPPSKQRPPASPGVPTQPRAPLSPLPPEQPSELPTLKVGQDHASPPSPSHPNAIPRALPRTFGQPEVYTPVDLKALKLLLHPSLATAVVEGALLQHLQGRLALLVGQHGVPVAAGQALPQRAVPGAAAGLGRAQLVGSHAVHGHPPAMGVLPRRGRGAGQRAEDLIWARGRGRRDEGRER